MNTCGSNLKAVDHANTRFSNGYAATGVGAIVCARHTILRKNGVCDLQKGERYINMDYILASTLVDAPLGHLLIVYDIACQWSKHLRDRLSELRSSIDVNLNTVKITTAIPKGHIKGHGKACQSAFSLNYLPGSARTDGEGVERDWAHMNALTASTREMGPGNRHETLDDHWGAWNWQKILKLGTSINTIYCFHHANTKAGVFLLRKLKDALANHTRQQAQFAELLDACSESGSKKIEGWDRAIRLWEEDHRNPDPYNETEYGKQYTAMMRRCTLTLTSHSCNTVGCSSSSGKRRISGPEVVKNVLSS